MPPTAKTPAIRMGSSSGMVAKARDKAVRITSFQLLPRAQPMPAPRKEAPSATQVRVSATSRREVCEGEGIRASAHWYG